MFTGFGKDADIAPVSVTPKPGTPIMFAGFNVGPTGPGITDSTPKLPVARSAPERPPGSLITPSLEEQGYKQPDNLLMKAGRAVAKAFTGGYQHPDVVSTPPTAGVDVTTPIKLPPLPATGPKPSTLDAIGGFAGGAGKPQSGGFDPDDPEARKRATSGSMFTSF